MLKATRILLLIVFALVICLVPTSLDAAPAQQVDEARTFDATIVAQGYVRGARGARDCRTGQLIDLSDGNFGARLQVGRTYHFENAWIYEGNPGQLFFLLSNSPRFRYWEISGCPAAAPPQVNFSVDQSRIVRGQCATLRWDVDNVRAIYLDGQGVTGHETRRVCPSSTTTYTLRAMTSSGDVVRSVTVNVSLPPPVLDFRADSTTIMRGDCTTLRWDAEYVQALYLDGSQVSSHANRQVCPSFTTTYNLQVVAESGNFTRSITVSVIQPTPIPIPTSTDTPRPRPTDVPRPTPTDIPTTEPPTKTPVPGLPPVPVPVPTPQLKSPPPTPDIQSVAEVVQIIGEAAQVTTAVGVAASKCQGFPPGWPYVGCVGANIGTETVKDIAELASDLWRKMFPQSKK
jgi:hypothetical protein